MYKPKKERSKYSSAPPPIFIGWYTVKEEQTVHDNSFETASAWVDYKVYPGAYPVYAYEFLNENGELSSTAICYACLEGIVVADFYENRVFWASSQQIDKNKGKDYSGTKSFYLYEADKISEFTHITDYERKENVTTN